MPPCLPPSSWCPTGATGAAQGDASYLEENRALVRIPVAGRVCAYALDTHEVWKGYDNAKEYAAFVTKTLVNKDGDIRRRIMSMFSPEERPNDDRDPNTLEIFEGTPHNEQRN